MSIDFSDNYMEWLYRFDQRNPKNRFIFVAMNESNDNTINLLLNHQFANGIRV